MKPILIFVVTIICLSSRSSKQEPTWKCHGTEPFWSLEISKKRGIIWSDTENNKETYSYYAPKSASGRMNDFIQVFQSSNKNGRIVVTLRQDSCSDGMSDEIYPYQVIILKYPKPVKTPAPNYEQQFTVYEGCCEMK